MGVGLAAGDQDTGTICLCIGGVIFAVIFAMNSSIHSYLILKYSGKDKVARTVGFYYMSNAMGRLVGTVGGGFLYEYVNFEVGRLLLRALEINIISCFV